MCLKLALDITDQHFLLCCRVLLVPLDTKESLAHRSVFNFTFDSIFRALIIHLLLQNLITEICFTIEPFCICRVVKETQEEKGLLDPKGIRYIHTVVVTVLLLESNYCGIIHSHMSYLFSVFFQGLPRAIRFPGTTSM